jgi:xylan 1,4-beta-xylosidase
LRRPLDGFSPLGRETGLDRIDWLDDGWPVVNGGRGPSDVHEAPADLTVSDSPHPIAESFTRDGFGPEWQFIRGRDPQAIKAGDRPGRLTLLTCSRHLTDLKQPSLILQRERLHRFSASCRMEFVSEGVEEAGLVAYYDSQSHLTLSISGNSWQTIRVTECRRGVSTILVEIREKNAGPIELRMDVDGLRRAFFYRRPGGSWKLASRISDASFLSDEGTAGWPFTGTMCGVFAIDNGTGKKLPAEVYDFRLDPRW